MDQAFEASSLTARRATFVTVVGMLVGSCLLPYTTSAAVGDGHEFTIEKKRNIFDESASAPIAFLGVYSPQFEASGTQTSFVMRFTALASRGPLTMESKATMPISREQPPAPLEKFSTSSTQRRAIALQSDSDKRLGEDRGSHRPFDRPPRLETNVVRINFNTPSLAPMSFTRFCMRYPQDCKIDRIAFRPKPVVMTKPRMRELITVNRQINRAIQPKANNQSVLAEEWLISPGEGDCKDYAVTKRHELLARGWPSRSLLLAEVQVASGEHHVVLVVRTRENDYVLDNLNWNVRPVSQIGYQWIRAQQASNPKFWSVISVSRATQVAMNDH